MFSKSKINEPGAKPETTTPDASGACFGSPDSRTCSASCKRFQGKRPKAKATGLYPVV